MARSLRDVNRYSTGRDYYRNGKVSGAGKILACTGPSYKRPEIMSNKTLSQMNAERARLRPRKKLQASSRKLQAASALKKTHLTGKIKK